MDTFDKKLLEEYSSLKATEKATKARLDELKEIIRPAMQATDIDKLDSDFGFFTLKPVPVWKYSSAVEDAEAKVEELKADEKARGIATETVRTDLVFKSKSSPTE